MFTLLGQQYEFDNWYEVEVLNSEAKRIRINNILKEQRFPALPRDFDISLKSTQGSLSKRVRAYYQKNHTPTCRITDSILSKITDAASVNDVAKVEIRFTKDFWEKTDGWGDSGSCWFTYNCGAPILIVDNGGFFVQFKKDNTKLGRAVALPANKADGYCFFNTKNASAGNDFSNALATLFKTPYHTNALVSISKTYPRKVLYFDSHSYFFGEGVPQNWLIDEKAYQTEECSCHRSKVVNKPCRFCGKEK